MNRLYTFNLEPKFDMRFIRSVNVQIAAIEKQDDYLTEKD